MRVFRNVVFVLILLIPGFNVLAQTKALWKPQPIAIQTRWAQQVNPNNPLPEYPRPQMVRENWQNLNGLWQYAITDSNALRPVVFDGEILVPYPIESALSGVKRSLLPSQILWYKRNFTIAKEVAPSSKLLLHFGAVDWEATVIVNGVKLGVHRGGYQQFCFDITSAVRKGMNEIVIRVFDPTNEGIGPHGKQTLKPQNIYYTATSGIWQTVWIEEVPNKYIRSFKLTPNIDSNLLYSVIDGPNGCEVELIAKDRGQVVSSVRGLIGNVLRLEVQNVKLWSPSNPFLYDLEINLLEGGNVTDKVKSYFGMRKIDIRKDERGIDRIFLNNKFVYNLGVLDQGFWPEGLYTAPTDEALKFDIEVIKSMGFNTIRKHIKVESARWYYYTDKIGMIVWQDFVNPNQGLPTGSKRAFERETEETVQQLYNSPSICTWVLFNEKWGQYDQERLTRWLRVMDSSRIINGHTGELLYVDGQLRSPAPSPYIGADLTDVHSYPYPMLPVKQQGKAQVLGEFGGVGVFVPDHQWNAYNAWGYAKGSVFSFNRQYQLMVDSLKKMREEGLSGSIYTQPFDVEGEQNGLMTYDREITKIPIDSLRMINSGLNLDMGTLSPVAVSNMDTTDPVSLYNRNLSDYFKGKRGSIFLYKLVVDAVIYNDRRNVRAIFRDYVSTIRKPYSREALDFVIQLTKNSTDAGFAILLNNKEIINSAFDKNVAENFIMNIIYREEIAPYDKDTVVNWEHIEEKVIGKYGDLGKERVWGCRMVYYKAVGDWVNFGKYYKKYFDKVIPLKRSFIHINNLSWPVFENINDTAVLNAAIKAMKFNVETYAAEDPQALDTYANLLYKMGLHKQAIEWEQKAVALSNNDKVLIEILNKMKKGVPTWN